MGATEPHLGATKPRMGAEGARDMGEGAWDTPPNRGAGARAGAGVGAPLFMILILSEQGSRKREKDARLCERWKGESIECAS
jgi:hypothetical protein